MPPGSSSGASPCRRTCGCRSSWCPPPTSTNTWARTEPDAPAGTPCGQPAAGHCGACLKQNPTNSRRTCTMINGEIALGQPIPWGLVGGGQSSQIGYIHRSPPPPAPRRRAGFFAPAPGPLDPAAGRARQFGQRLGVSAERCHADYRALFEAEARRPDGIRAVSVATPNDTHFEICQAALHAGLHVVCEKPLCFTSAQARELLALSGAKNKIVGVTYGYSGHQLIEQARAMIARGDLGQIRIVQMQFAHGFHSTAVEAANPSTRWRVDPKFAGP